MKFLYALHDLAREFYYAPVICLDDQAAKTLFYDLCEDKETLVGQRPTDFCLYRVGMWNEETAELQSDQYRVARGAEYTPLTHEELA